MRRWCWRRYPAANSSGARKIAARLYDIPHSTRRQVSVDTLLDWTLRYRRNGLAALSPKPRQDRGQARAVPAIALTFASLRRVAPVQTLPRGERSPRLATDL